MNLEHWGIIGKNTDRIVRVVGKKDSPHLKVYHSEDQRKPSVWERQQVMLFQTPLEAGHYLQTQYRTETKVIVQNFSSDFPTASTRYKFA